MESKQTEIKEVRAFGLERRVVYEGKWLVFKQVDYQIGEKTLKNWECVERPSKDKVTKECDGVEAIGIIRYKDKEIKPQIVMIANYRPPVDNYVLEFPAGLLDEDGDLFDNALRELEEETGYTGKRPDQKAIETQSYMVSPAFFYDPWKSNESSKVVMVDIDGDDERNKNVTQKLEDTESIRVHLLEFNSKALDGLLALAKEKNYAISGHVYSFFLGLAMAETIRST